MVGWALPPRPETAATGSRKSGCATTLVGDHGDDRTDYRFSETCPYHVGIPETPLAPWSVCFATLLTFPGSFLRDRAASRPSLKRYSCREVKETRFTPMRFHKLVFQAAKARSR